MPCKLPLLSVFDKDWGRCHLEQRSQSGMEKRAVWHQMQLRWILVVPGLATVDPGSAEWDSETFECIASPPGPQFSYSAWQTQGGD